MPVFLSKPLCLAALALACTAARADWVLPAGASAHLGGGTASMGCVNVQSSGTLTLGGGTLVAARDVATAAGAQLQIDSGQVQLAQQWINAGTVTATSGGVTRQPSPGCPVVGKAGPIPLTAPPGPGGAGGPHAIPTLGEWGLLLLSALAALAGLRRLRAPAATRRPRPSV